MLDTTDIMMETQTVVLIVINTYQAKLKHLAKNLTAQIHKHQSKKCLPLQVLLFFQNAPYNIFH